MTTDQALLDDPAVAKKKTTPVRLTDEAIKWARIASGYTGESMSEFVSRVVEEQGRLMVGKLHDEVMGEKPQPKGKEAPKR